MQHYINYKNRVTTIATIPEAKILFKEIKPKRAEMSTNLHCSNIISSKYFLVIKSLNQLSNKIQKS
jgi:hypothetical protein